MKTETLTGTHTASALELISFIVRGQEFCVDISDIIEIRGWAQETPIAQSPEFVRGVISLRGVVMPVVDLGLRLGMGKSEASERNVIVVAHLPVGQVGLLVDAVCDTMMINAAQIQTSDTVAGNVAPDFVCGFLPLENRMVTVLTLGRIFESGELKTGEPLGEAADIRAA
jgi:purine-binding chemotaxis protein CheW